MRDRYHSLLQVVGCVIVILYHGGWQQLSAGWLTVEVFFALAAFNLFRRGVTEEPGIVFARRRYVRLLPALLLVAPLVLWLCISRSDTVGWRFLLLAPLQLHNVIPLAQTNWLGGDAVWIPLWFLAALFQLQWVLHAVRHGLTAAPLWKIMAVAIGAGVAGRMAIFFLLAGEGGGASAGFDGASRTFWSPFGHLEVMVFGALVALRRPSVRTWLLGIAGCALAGYLGVLAYEGVPTQWTAAFPFALPTGWNVSFAYLLLAALMAVLIDPSTPWARAVSNARWPEALDEGLAKLSRWTFFAYAVHGSLYWIFYQVLSLPRSTYYDWSSRRRMFVTLACVAGSFVVGAAVQLVWDRVLALFSERRTKSVSSEAARRVTTP